MSYKELEIWKIADLLVVDIHNMSLNLPKFELYEEGSQIRRSIKSVKSTIVEGYGRRMYKQEFVKFLVYASASTDETRDHLDTIFKTNSLTNETLYNDYCSRLDILGKKIHLFIKGVQKTEWKQF
jgi:four helix bundle protein